MRRSVNSWLYWLRRIGCGVSCGRDRSVPPGSDCPRGAAAPRRYRPLRGELLEPRALLAALPASDQTPWSIYVMPSVDAALEPVSEVTAPPLDRSESASCTPEARLASTRGRIGVGYGAAGILPVGPAFGAPGAWRWAGSASEKAKGVAPAARPEVPADQAASRAAAPEADQAAAPAQAVPPPAAQVVVLDPAAEAFGPATREADQAPAVAAVLPREVVPAVEVADRVPPVVSAMALAVGAALRADPAAALVRAAALAEPRAAALCPGSTWPPWRLPMSGRSGA